MFGRPLSFFTDIIIFALTYCFLFVSVIILFYDRNMDYDRFIMPFYLLMMVSYYLYFIVPVLLKGKTLGKRLFKISVENHKSIRTIIGVHIKYLIIRLLPIVSILLVFEVSSIVFKIVFALIALYPIFDYYYLKANDVSFTDQLLKINIKVY